MISNLEYLKAFYYTAKYLSITAAAEALFISQPAVSLTIKRLEGELGCKLFFRTTKGARLTPEGEVFYQHISAAFDELFAAERALSDMLNFESGEIRIGASDMTMRFFLLPYLEKFHTLYPKIKILVSNAPTPETLNSLEGGKIDFGIISTPIEKSDNYSIVSVAEIRDIFVAGERFSHLKSTPVPLSELEKLPIICLEKNTTTRKSTDDFLKKNSVVLSPEFELAQSDLIVQFAEMNMGIGSVVDRFAENSIKNGRLFELSLQTQLPTRNIALVTGKRRPVSKAGQRLLELFF